MGGGQDLPLADQHAGAIGPAGIVDSANGTPGIAVILRRFAVIMPRNAQTYIPCGRWLKNTSRQNSGKC
jgi:hypothetical protein